MKLKMYITGVLLLLIVSVGCSKAPETKPKQIETPKTNVVKKSKKTAPNFTLVDTKGKKITLSDYKGKIVLLDFWATWCPPCRKSIPELVELQKEYKGKLIILGISLDTNTKDDIIPFMKEQKINYPILYANEEVVNAYGGIQSIPTTFFIDQEGFIVSGYIGYQDKEVFKNEIEQLLK